MKLQLDPLDTLFFRDGRPFSMGEETYAEGLFPPAPATVLGALRSLWISSQLDQPGATLEDLARESLLKLNLDYFGLGIAGKPVFPAPFDLFFPKKDAPAKPMETIGKEAFISSCPPEVTHLFRGDVEEKTESIAGQLLDETAMNQYLEGGTAKDFETLPLKNFVKKEHKIGIGRKDGQNLTEEGLLFRLIANRLENKDGERLEFLVDVQGFDLPNFENSKTAVLPLGGERRSVMAKIAVFQLPTTASKITGKLFKIWLLTPAPLDNWYPAELLEKYKGLKLVASAVGKPVAVGGWDVAKKQPKPMRRAIPAGSVFLFEATDEAQANQISEDLHGKSLCQFADERDGFGLCFIAQPFDNQNI